MARRRYTGIPNAVWALEEYLGIPHVKNKQIYKDYDKANIQRRKAIENRCKEQHLESLE